MNTAVINDCLVSEYEHLIAKLGDDPTDAEIIASLAIDAAWTPNGAATLLMLAQEYGTAVLRNALALAGAMGIEDGTSGM